VTTAAPEYPLHKIAKKLSVQVAEEARPLSAQIHLIKKAGGAQLLIPNGNRLYNIPEEIEQKLSRLLELNDEAGITAEIAALGLDAPLIIDDTPLESPPIYALSLAIAQKCNMGCAYCYADQGDFGGPMKNMPLETALKSIDLLLKDCPENGKVQLTFLGGEPLINRKALREATEYASKKASEKNVRVGFSITTNGTLLTEDDAFFL